MVDILKKIGKLFLLCIPLLILGFYILMFDFGCGLGMGRDFDCRVLVLTSGIILFLSVIIFIVLAIGKFVFDEKLNKIILIVYIIGLILTIATLIFAANYKNIPESKRLKYFEGQTVESCASDRCFFEIFRAEVANGENPSVEICHKITDAAVKRRCILEHQAFVEGDFSACLEITSLSEDYYDYSWAYLSYSPGDSEERARMEREQCYRKVALLKKNNIVNEYINGFVESTYTTDMCSEEQNPSARNFCYYTIGDCDKINAGTIIQEDCKINYKESRGSISYHLNQQISGDCPNKKGSGSKFCYFLMDECDKIVEDPILKENCKVKYERDSMVLLADQGNLSKSEICSKEEDLEIRNYCYYVIYQCEAIESASKMQNNCKERYKRDLLDHPSIIKK